MEDLTAATTLSNLRNHWIEVLIYGNTLYIDPWTLNPPLPTRTVCALASMIPMHNERVSHKGHHSQHVASARGFRSGVSSFLRLLHACAVGALDWLLGSFEYGTSNVLKRLFKPKIDRLMFAASKADHITPDQQNNLVKLLDSMLHTARKQIQFDGVVTESTAIAAIRASKPGVSEHQGEQLQVLQGQGMDGQQITLFPGDVPEKCPDDNFWQRQGFDFPKFAPPTRSNQHCLPHIRMDQVLDFLLGDKLV